MLADPISTKISCTGPLKSRIFCLLLIFVFAIAGLNISIYLQEHPRGPKGNQCHPTHGTMSKKHRTELSLSLSLSQGTMNSGTDPGFLERGSFLNCVCVRGGVALLNVSHLSYITNENEIIWSH